MSHQRQRTLFIERLICCLVAAVGAILIWASTSHAATPVPAEFQDLLPTRHALASGPEPATLIILTAGIVIVALKMRGEMRLTRARNPE